MALNERVRGHTIASILAGRATTDPEGRFLLFEDSALTFGQVEDQAEALAASLHEQLGIGAGDRLAIALPNWPEFVVTTFAAAKLGVAEDKFYSNIHRYGNTTAASIPICLSEVLEQNMLHEGDLVMIVAFGAGFTWGASLMRW